PYADLSLSGSTLFGTAYLGCSPGNGTVFAINTDGTGFTNLYIFTPTSCYSGCTNTDGAHPRGHLIVSSNILYGTTDVGGTLGQGTVFAMRTDGTVFSRVLKNQTFV